MTGVDGTGPEATGANGTRSEGARRRPQAAGALRPMEEADLERVLAWRNHPDVRRWMYTTHEIGMEEHRSWFAASAEVPGRHLLVYELDGEPCGFVNVSVDGTAGAAGASATWGFYLAPDAPRGSGRGLGQAAIDHAFGTMALEELRGEALASNANSIAFHRRLGFEAAGAAGGERREQDGEPVEVACFRLGREAWMARRTEDETRP